MEKSYISLEAKLSKAFIEKTIERELRTLIGKEGLQIQLPQGELLIENIDNVRYNVSSKDIKLSADVEVEYNKEEGINVLGQAIIHLDFRIDYVIQSDFTLKTKTHLTNHEWVEKPTIKFGKLRIPTKAALNLMINSFDTEVGNQIDSIIAKKLDLQKIVTDQLTKLENPIPNPLDKNIHLYIDPQTLLFNIAEQEKDYRLAIHTTFDASVQWEHVPVEKIFSSLPYIEEYYGETKDSKLFIPIKVNYEALTNMLVRQFAKVEVLGRQLQIKDIRLHYTDRLNIKAIIEGDYSGTLEAHTKPRLDVASQTLYLDDFDYELSTKNFLVKAAVFLFKGEIDKRLDQFTKVPLQPIIKPLIAKLNDKLDEFDIEGLEFQLELNHLELHKLELQKDSLIADAEIAANQLVA